MSRCVKVPNETQPWARSAYCGSFPFPGGLLENLGPGECDHRVHDAAGWPNSLAGSTEDDFLVKRIQRDS